VLNRHECVSFCSWSGERERVGIGNDKRVFWRIHGVISVCF